MDLKSIVDITKGLDKKGFYRQADRITIAFMKKEAIFYLQALTDTETLSALVNALSNFYSKKDVDAVIDEKGLKNSDQSAFMKYDTSDIKWQQAFDDFAIGLRNEELRTKIQKREAALEKLIKNPAIHPVKYAHILAMGI